MTEEARGPTLDITSEQALNSLMSAEHPTRRELWKLYDEAAGSRAQRTGRVFWQTYP